MTVQLQDATLATQPQDGGGKSIVVTKKSDGTVQRIELSPSGEIITSSVEGVPATAVAAEPPAAPRRKALPDGLVDMMGIIMGAATVMSLGTPLVKAWARRFERRHEIRQQTLIEQRLVAIEQAIETVAVEVERISEGQRFTTKLLAERAPAEAERVR
ncbi:hypothetical protein [Gemmatimonas sp.]|jgi:hypothetical protein|uniref:hypothetical protein n=1 Tax=Gemmatimonas sp. TaxID=1962908 RepID=UPI0022BFDB6A|nr:hypothetical protein [Gemmatimonas sp.]MCZ8204182.1 hypothetical protein [Gemmatimonas sp.]